jgi:N-acetylneuraminic acid mutarotase
LYAIAGEVPSGPTNIVEAYDVTSNHWTELPVSLPTPRWRIACAVGPQGQIYAVGGFNGANVLGSVEVLNPFSSIWSEVAALTFPRYRHAAAFGADGNLYVFGGFDGTNLVSAVEAFDGGAWQAVNSLPNPRMSLGAAATDGGILVVGGDNGVGPQSEVDLYVPDPNGGTWQTMAPLNHPRWGMAVTEVNGMVYAIGGYDGVQSTSWVEAWVPGAAGTGGQWLDLPPLPTPRWGLSAVVGPDGRIYAIGGLSGFTGPMLGTVEAYTPSVGGGPGWWE